jgi:hypothetical protein
VIDQEKKRIAAVIVAINLSRVPPLGQIAEHSIDVLTLDTIYRKTLLDGPTIDLIANGVVIRKNVALRALIASCQRVNDVIQIKPTATKFRMHGHVDRQSVEGLLDIFTTSKLLEFDRINLRSDDLCKDILTYQACLALGIHYTHTIPLLNALRAVVSSRLLKTDELDVLATRLPASNPLIKHVANDLCHRRFKKQIPDIGEFERWLDGKSKEGLKKAMMEYDREHKNTRQATTRRKCDWKNHDVLCLWGEDVDGVYIEKENQEEVTEPEATKRRDSKT